MYVHAHPYFFSSSCFIGSHQVDYLSDLHEAIVEAYTGIINGLTGGGDASILLKVEVAPGLNGLGGIAEFLAKVSGGNVLVAELRILQQTEKTACYFICHLPDCISCGLMIHLLSVDQWLFLFSSFLLFFFTEHDERLQVPTSAPQEEVIKGAVGLVGDLAKALGKHSAQYLAPNLVTPLLQVRSRVKTMGCTSIYLLVMNGKGTKRM